MFDLGVSGAIGREKQVCWECGRLREKLTWLNTTEPLFQIERTMRTLHGQTKESS